VRILDPNWAATFAWATAVVRRLPQLLAAFDAGRRMRTSSWSFPSSSCSWRTPTLSRRHHPSPEEPPGRCEPQPPSAESFPALGEHPHDPLSILPFRPSRLLHQSALTAVLRWAARSAMVTPGFPCRTAVGRGEADLHRPSMDQQPGLELEDIPSHFKSLPGIWEPSTNLFHVIFSRKIIW
jgi:hypothetical protein